MSYTEDQIKKYLEILHNYTKKPVEEVRRSKCWNCQNSECFFIHLGFKICDYCNTSNGHVLGFYDVKDYDRLYFRKKVFIRESIIMRKRLIKFLKE